MGFEIINDRFFIADLGRIIEIDQFGNLVKDYSDLKNQNGISISPSFFGANHSYLKNDKLYFSSFDFNAFQLETLKGSMVYSLDLLKNELTEIVDYPDFNLKPISNDYLFHNNILVLENYVIFNYSSKNLFKFSLNTKKWELVNANSIDHLEVSEYFGDKTNYTDSKKHFSQNGIYRTLIWDSFREVYYRIYSLPNDQLESNGRKTRIIVLNNDFNIFLELKIPNYLSHIGYHITQEGLFLYDGHFAKENEDEFRFVKVYPN